MGSILSGAVSLCQFPPFMLGLVFALYLSGIYWLTRRCRGFWNDSEGLTIDELASLLSLGLWIYVGINLALLGDKITEVQVDFFEVLTWLPLATVAKQVVSRFGLPGKRGHNSNQGGGYYDPYGGGGYAPPYNPASTGLPPQNQEP